MHITALFSALASLSLALPFSESALRLDGIEQLERRDGSGSVTGPGLAWYSNNLSTGGKGYANANTYTCYSGVATNFPPITKWLSFNNLWTSAVNAELHATETTNEQGYLRAAILNIANQSSVDPRVILSVVLIESSGNLSVPCSTSPEGIRNCGIMQSYNPDDTSYNPQAPHASILQMLRDGTQGTASGPGLVQLFNDAPDTHSATGGNVYKVLRGYNSGTVYQYDLSLASGANPYYVSHIANYLQGWNGYGNYQSCSLETHKPSTTSTTSTAAPTCNPTSTVAAPAPTMPNTTKSCCKYYVAQSGDYCQKIADANMISLQMFYALNPDIKSDCSNLWVGEAYCVNGNVASSSTTVTATAAAATIKTSTTSTISTVTATSTIKTTITTTAKPVTTAKPATTLSK